MNFFVGNFQFNPVGHGLFYSGTITDDLSQKTFSFVYDCGGTDRTIVSNAISNANLPDKIDLLIISHFHEDHIKGVPQIKGRVKKVILPYLDDGLKALYLAALADNPAAEDTEELRNLILNPREFFGGDVEVFQMRNSEDSQSLEIHFGEDGFSSKFGPGNQNSTSGRDIVWLFHFFMPKIDSNFPLILNFFSEKGITTDNAASRWDEIKNKMTNLHLNNNISNLVCAHGPSDSLRFGTIRNNILLQHCFIGDHKFYPFGYIAGFQFLTGDAEIDDEHAFVARFKKELFHSILFQIPHHGSQSNWHDWFSSHQPFCVLWPVTHNANNKFRRGTFPSATFTYITPHSVTEDPNTFLGLQMFIEHP